MPDNVRTEDGVPIGNHYDKYATGNPIARALRRGFERNVLELVQRAGAQDIHEVGCGEGHLARIIASTAPERFRASDFSGDIVATAREHGADLDVEFLQRDVYALGEEDGAELIVCCEVLEHLANGLATKQIARKLHLSVKTVETHRAHIMKKLDTRSVALLTKYAIRNGIVSLDD